MKFAKRNISFMIRIQKPIKIPIVCADSQIAIQWQNELKTAGIPVVAGSESVHTGSFATDKALLLIQPNYNQAATYNRFFNHAGKQIFLITDDARWRNFVSKETVHFIPESTHPMELARLMVEKLNLPVIANKQSDAFAFFSF